ncbi:uncharacterized protein LOC128964310 [Oppia nitens]|uniref:uncharacterized protein LOC128964310 n=1 Tax=Oppia nitens TaxID=1686743 RepID=UPI0023DC8066|nr:uncharacterized protein LOC128964310 [Oppia nitens]
MTHKTNGVFGADICEETYVDSVFMIRDGINVRRSDHLWHYSYDFKLISVDNQIQKLRHLLNNNKTIGHVLSGLYVPEINCNDNDNMVKAIESAVDDNEIINCTTCRRWHTNLLLVIYRDDKIADDCFAFKQVVPVTNQIRDIQDTNFHNGWQTNGTITQRIIPIDWGKLQDTIAMYYEPNNYQIFMILNKSPKDNRQSSALFWTSLNTVNWIKYLKQSALADDLTYNGFIRYQNQVYAVAEPYGYHKTRRGPSQLYLFDPISKTLTKHVSKSNGY